MKKEKTEQKLLSEPSTLIKTLDFIRLIAECFLIAVIITTFFFRKVNVVGASMNPTLKDSQQGFANVISYILSGAERGDVVIVKSPEVEGEQWVKRVIGVPGDIISYEKNVLTINGEVIEEDYAVSNPDTYRSNLDFKDLKIGEDEYFVMGDNRDHSRDSREVGVFHKEDILAKGVYIFYPFDEMSVVK